MQVLEAKAIGLLFWMTAVPRPYSLVSVFTTFCLVQSKYVRVVLSSVLHIHCLSQSQAASVDGFQLQCNTCSQRNVVLEAKSGMNGCR